MAKKPTPRCECIVQKHKVTTIQRIALFKDAQCEFKGRYEIHGHHFCKTHAKLYAEGHINPNSLQMTGPQSMADIRRSWCPGSRRMGIHPMYESDMVELFGDERARWAMALGRPLQPWDEEALEQGRALSSIVKL